MKLVIISHTPHYKKNGVIVGWGSTIAEVNHLTKLFSEIYHIAPLHNEAAPDSSLAYESEKIKFIPISTYGGVNLKDKLSVLTTAPGNLKTISSVLKKSGSNDWIQFRAPTAMGMYVIPYLSFFRKSKLWVKYAGNWNMDNPPLSYKFQKWWLENNFQNSKVTINGYWEGQKSHIINFQNPCMDSEELLKAKEKSKNKNFDGKLSICFVGALSKNKGVDLILESLVKIKDSSEIDKVVFAGDGIERSKYEKLSKKINVEIEFTGFINRKELELIYEKSHIIVLPSESEGFPKVIAEAAAYGCVPVVSDVSSISQYFDETKAYLLKNINSSELTDKINQAFSNRSKLKIMSENCVRDSEKFTYEHYLKSLSDKILI